MSSHPNLQPASDVHVMRVDQLDAGVLDSELHGLLKTQLGRACSGLPAGTLERFKPEVDALFNLLMFRFTVWIQRPTPGMHLQGLRYRNEAAAHGPAPVLLNGLTRDPLSSVWGNETGVPVGASGCSRSEMNSSLAFQLPEEATTQTQRLLHGLLSVVLQWGFARLRRHGLVNGWGGAEPGSARRVIWHALRRLETLFRLAWLLNLLLFLRDGKYVTLVDRLVKMRMVYERPDAGPRPINYQFLNRRLLWDHWSRMVYVIAPLINWASIRRAFARGTGRLRREARALGVIGGSDRARHDATLGSGTFAREARDTSPRYTAATSSLCAECGATPAKTPYVAGCSHVFCYYCIRMACTVDNQYACPSCGERFATSTRWSQAR